MSGNPFSFKVLPWVIPKSYQNFVPDHSRFYTRKKTSIFIAWRDDKALIYILQNSKQCLSKQQPSRNQMLSSKGNILDVIAIDSYIYFVSSAGLFQILCSKDSGEHRDILEHLGDCRSFLLVDAFALSPLKKLLTLATVPTGQHASYENNFAVITYMEDNSKIDAELYSVSWTAKSIGEAQLQYVHNVCDGRPLKGEQEKCVCLFLTDEQVRELFPLLKDTEILLMSIGSGQLFCIPFLISNKIYGIKPAIRLIYQSVWPIIGLTCPSGGSNIFLFLEGGTVLSISPQSNKSGDIPSSSLSYSSFTLPYSINCFSVLKNDLMVISDGVSMSVLNPISPNQTDIHLTSLRGVTTTTVVPETNLIVASTFHNVFYLLDPLNSARSIDCASSTWTGGSLDVSLQLVQEMKKQTELLSQLRNEVKEEDCIIRALSAVSRAALLSDCFTTTVVVIGAHKQQELGHLEEDNGATPDDIQQTFQLSVEIRNNSSEDFTPLLWQICLQICYPDGISLSKNFPLSKTLSHDSQFSTTLNLPCITDRFSFPIQVKAALVAELKERHCPSQWLQIQIGSASLDISHFFSLSFQPPPFGMRQFDKIAGYISQMNLQSPGLKTEDEELKERSSMMSYVIPIPDQFRKPNIVLEKLMCNCRHHHKHLETEKDFCNQSDKTVIFITVLGETVRLEFRKSCVSITISSKNVEMLHSIKLCLVTMFSTQNLSANDAPLIKAKNLGAILETQSLEEFLDSKELLVIYQDLRNSVSSQIF